MNFSEYLISKKIDAQAFVKGEPNLFHTWEKEFEQMHPNSFTIQKLNLINPVRRKYQLKEAGIKPAESLPSEGSPPVSKPGKPVIKPKPKFN